jgi:arylsulfatase A-like enzyme
VLTSGTHHPYRLPASIARSETFGTAKERYLRGVEIEDALIGRLMSELENRGLLDHTVVIIVGDHGEGFGRHGVRQHDNDFYEEGLRVPFLLAGPGVPRQEVSGNGSLVDVAPSVLDVLGVSLTASARGALAGRSVLSGALPAIPRWFVCFYDDHCVGFVQGHDKVVVLPWRETAFTFDLADDPDEADPRQVGPERSGELTALRRLMDTHRARIPGFPIVAGAVNGYGDWRCPAGAPCRHPRSPDGFFQQPGD